jgi:hypothetical protein
MKVSSKKEHEEHKMRREIVLNTICVLAALFNADMCFGDSWASFSGTYPAVPTARLDVQDAVPMSTLEKIGDEIAHYVWRGQITRGTPIPLADKNGDIYAYAFPYIRGGRKFPDFEEIFHEISDLRSEYWAMDVNEDPSSGWTMPGEYYEALSRMGSEFGTVFVSATRNDFPVLRAIHFLHPYFVVGELAQEKARNYLNSDDLTLKTFYYLSPSQEYFEFVSGEESILIDGDLLEITTYEEALETQPDEAVEPEVLEQIRIAWEQAEAITPALIPEDEINIAHTVKEITYKELIPIVNHTGNPDGSSHHWCVVASKAMILGFWDNYVPSIGTVGGFGRLIDYWYEYNPGGHNMPNLADEALLSIPDLWKTNNYTCQWVDTYAWLFNDWAWDTIKAEIDAGRPLFWSFPGHTMAAFGYVVKGSSRLVRVYTADNPNTPTYISDELYLKCNGITTVIPQGGTNGDHLIICSPDGEETFNTADPATITWYVWGNKIKRTTLVYSIDGGMSWIGLASKIPTKGSENVFVWFPDQTTSKARVCVRGYTDTNELIAGDGSQKNFYITSKQSSGYYNILHKHSGKYVCTGFIHNGGNIHIWGPIPSGHEDRYKFEFISTEDGYYNIRHKYSGKYVCTGDTQNGGNIHIWGLIPSGHEDRYKFKLIPTLDGYYNILHKYSGKYVCSGDTENDGNIHIWGPIPIGHENRYKFNINPVP